MLADVLEHLAEIGQIVEQPIHLWKRGRLDREALAAEAQHLLVHRAQRFVGTGRKLVERFLHPRDVVDILEAGNGNYWLWLGDGIRHEVTFLFFDFWLHPAGKN